MSDSTESSSGKEGSDEQVPGSSAAGAKRKYSSDESDQNPDGNVRGRSMRTPLHYAALRGNEKLVRRLLASGASTSTQDRYGMTPLHCSLYTKNYSVALIILNTNAENNIQDEEGKTPLHYAASWGLEEIVNKLLASNASTRIQDRCGRTPLHWALGNKHDSVALTILNADSVKNNIQDKDGKTPLHYASSWGFEEIVRKMLASGASTRLQDACGMTPLHNALQRGHVSVALVIMNTDADNNIQDDYGETPLHCAAALGSEEIVRKMLASGASVRFQDQNGMTPLYHALCNYHDLVASIILNTDHVNNIQDEDGITPLHLSTSFLDITKTLLFSGVNPHCMSNDGESPLEIALRFDKYVVAKILLSMCVLSNIAIKWEAMKVPPDSIQRCIQLVKECNAEIQCLKSRNVDGTLFSYHDVATEHVNKLAVHLENDLIRSALVRERDDNWALEFPIYGELISFKVRSAETKRILRAQFFECFTFLSRSLPSLPRIGIDVILTYLSDLEVRNFVKAFQLKE